MILKYVQHALQIQNTPLNQTKCALQIQDTSIENTMCFANKSATVKHEGKVPQM